MPIPNTHLFESFIGSCEVVTSVPKGPYFTLRGDTVLDHDRPAKPIFLSYPESALPLDALLSKVTSHMAAQRCIANERISAAALAMAITTRPPAVAAAPHLNEFLSQIHRAQIMQAVVLPGRPRTEYELALGTYKIKSFRSKQILYWAERCGSSYPIDLRTLDGRASLEREPFEIVLLDCQRKQYWTRQLEQNPGHVDDLLDCYYSEVAQAWADQISNQVKEDILILESAALFWIDVEDLLNVLFMQIVTLITWKHDRGFAGWASYSSQTLLNANFPPPALLQQCRDWLSSELNFVDLSNDRPLDQTTKTYCRFLQRAHGHRLAGRLDEGFLHFAIALDLLLGTESRASESVANHSALLVHRQLGKTLEQQTSAVKNLYGVRSRYVHTGKSATPNELMEIEEIATEVLWTLLATIGIGEVQNHEEWMRRLGYIHAALRADKQLDESEFKAVGIPPSGHRRIRPNRVQG